MAIHLYKLIGALQAKWSNKCTFSIHVCWIPGHAGVYVNEEADKLASTTLRERRPGLFYDLPNEIRCILRQLKELQKNDDRMNNTETQDSDDDMNDDLYDHRDSDDDFEHDEVGDDYDALF